MKFFIVFAVVLATAAALPQFRQYQAQPQQFVQQRSADGQAQVTQQESDIAPDLSQYRTLYATSNGIQAEETGQLKQVPGAESPSYSARGQYSYTGPDGQQYTIQYIADENGFQPQGAHIPRAPQ